MCPPASFPTAAAVLLAGILALAGCSPVLSQEGGESAGARESEAAPDREGPESPAARPPPTKAPPRRGADEMALIPGGPFLMGTPATSEMAPEDEKPQHQVTLPAFRIDRFEITNAQYRRFLFAARREHPATCHSAEEPGKDHTPPERWWRDPEWNAPEKPVVGVDWFDAYAYCAWSGKRLPTEAEWEKAARGEDGRWYPWGNLPPDSGRLGNFADEAAKRLYPEWRVVNGYDDGFAHTAPVGSFPAGASPYGVQDMAGNVWEWVNDYYSKSLYAAEPRSSPKGPLQGDKRVVRGGSWDSTPNFLRTSVRYGRLPVYRGNAFGFRCAREAPAAAGP